MSEEGKSTGISSWQDMPVLVIVKMDDSGFLGWKESLGNNYCYA